MNERGQIWKKEWREHEWNRIEMKRTELKEDLNVKDIIRTWIKTARIIENMNEENMNDGTWMKRT